MCLFAHSPPSSQSPLGKRTWGWRQWEQKEEPVPCRQLTASWVSQEDARGFAQVAGRRGPFPCCGAKARQELMDPSSSGSSFCCSRGTFRKTAPRWTQCPVPCVRAETTQAGQPRCWDVGLGDARSDWRVASAPGLMQCWDFRSNCHGKSWADSAPDIYQCSAKPPFGRQVPLDHHRCKWRCWETCECQTACPRCFSVWPWPLPFTVTWWCCFSPEKGFYVNASAAAKAVPSRIHGYDGDCSLNMGNAP